MLSLWIGYVQVAEGSGGQDSGSFGTDGIQFCDAGESGID
jgi:hypothetical protein